MYQGIRQTFVVLLALGLAAGGVARSALAFTPGEPCHTASYQHTAERAGHVHHHADDAASHHDHGRSDRPGNPDAFFKCCELCTASSNTTAVAQLGQIVFIGAPISYVLSGDDYAGQGVRIDPGIPKRMA